MPKTSDAFVVSNFHFASAKFVVKFEVFINLFKISSNILHLCDWKYKSISYLIILNFGRYMGNVHLALICVEFEKEMKPTNAPRDLRVPYKHIKLPTCTCFDHSCGHPQGGV